MKLYIVILSITIMIIGSCSNTTENEGNMTLKGSLYYEGLPLDGASVNVDNQLNWSTQTDSEGNFEINGITSGEHVLRASKQLEGDQVTSIESSVTLTETVTDLGEIRLPIPPRMYEVDSIQVTYESVPLKWSMAPDPEFREYKLYRLDHPGLDETTGELIFVSTSLSDTTFTDETILPATRYYYRIYTLSAFGKLGGSNMVNILIPQKNLVQNPDFEISSNGVHPDVWKDGVMKNAQNEYITEILLDSIEVYHGNYSGKMVANPENLPFPNMDAGIIQLIYNAEFEIGSEYEFSMWIKTGDIKLWIQIIEPYPYANWWSPVLNGGWIEENTEWTKYSDTFIARAENLRGDAQLSIYFDTYSQTITGYAWLDEVKIVKIPD